MNRTAGFSQNPTGFAFSKASTSVDDELLQLPPSVENGSFIETNIDSDPPDKPLCGNGLFSNGVVCCLYATNGKNWLSFRSHSMGSPLRRELN